ncbi:hypothetical protein LIER_09948 [Lithospermum erythrorhizon]|uniref:Uncharacterized protein n=1 Tax=Lithospermum erythrorhizon TaxID=34254 RepID=A0AAV3PHL2_LITER
MLFILTVLLSSSNLSKGSMTVVAYYFKLRRLWDELSVLETLPGCSCISVKDQILMMDPWPNLNEAYCLVLTIERKSQLGGNFFDERKEEGLGGEEAFHEM